MSTCRSTSAMMTFCAILAVLLLLPFPAHTEQASVSSSTRGIRVFAENPLGFLVQWWDEIRNPVTPSAVKQRSGEEIVEEFRRILADQEAAIAKYASLVPTDNGKILDTDIARELSPAYVEDRTRSHFVHAQASSFVKALYAKRLAHTEPHDEHCDGSVLFTAGGTGAGKSTILTTSAVAAEAYRKAHIVYDANMKKFASSDFKIQQALEAKRRVFIVYAYRDPVDSLVDGALPRAERQRELFGTGRTVPIKEHAQTHAGAYEVMTQLFQKYRSNPMVTFFIADTTNYKMVEKTLEELKPINVNTIAAELLSTLHEEFIFGRISRETYLGALGGEEPVPEFEESHVAPDQENTDL